MMSKESKSIILHDDLTSSRSLIILLTRNHSVARSFQIKFDMKVINLHSYLIEQNNIRQNFRRTKFLFEQNFRSLLKSYRRPRSVHTTLMFYGRSSAVDTITLYGRSSAVHTTLMFYQILCKNL